MNSRKWFAPLTPSMADLTTGLAATSYTSGEVVSGPNTLSATNHHQDVIIMKLIDYRYLNPKQHSCPQSSTSSNSKNTNKKMSTKSIGRDWIILIAHDLITVRIPSNLIPFQKLPLAASIIPDQNSNQS